MCECAIGVYVCDGAAVQLPPIVALVVMGCIVLGRQMNVDFSITSCSNTFMFVGMDIRSCTMKIHNRTIKCKQTTTPC